MYNVALIHFHTKQIIKTDFLKTAKKKKKKIKILFFLIHMQMYTCCRAYDCLYSSIRKLVHIRWFINNSHSHKRNFLCSSNANFYKTGIWKHYLLHIDQKYLYIWINSYGTFSEMHWWSSQHIISFTNVCIKMQSCF